MLIRTPIEHVHHRLENAELSTMMATPYSDSANRIFRAVLALDPHTQSLAVQWKDGKSLNLDILLKNKTIIISDKWKSFSQSHTAVSCSYFNETEAEGIQIEHFECDHILASFHRSILNELCNDDTLQQRQIESILLDATEKFKDMPIMVTSSVGEQEGEIIVSWSHVHSEMEYRKHGRILKGWVSLHRESTCTQLREELFCPGN